MAKGGGVSGGHQGFGRETRNVVINGTEQHRFFQGDEFGKQRPVIDLKLPLDLLGG